MKKIDKDKRTRLMRLTCIRTRRHQRRKYGLFARTRNKEGFIKIEAPEFFAITLNESSREKVILFIRKIRDKVNARKKILINFNETKKMFTCGTLLFTSEIRNIYNSITPKPTIRCLPSKNIKVMQVLKQIGILTLLKFKKYIKPTYKDVIKWKFASGNNADGSQYETILSHLDDKLDKEIQKGLYAGLVEAMVNTHHHAYIEQRPESFVEFDKESWWSFSQVKDGKLYVVFCDLGIGIPKSLPKQRPDWFKIISQIFKDNISDDKIIHEAIKLSATRTGKSYRGKGLKQLIKAIERVENSYISILSNKGGYRRKNGLETTYKYINSIGGTLIEWQLPLS